MPRYIPLEHRGAPDDPDGLHYDLMIEDGDGCRTWRLDAVPPVGGGEVTATEIARHRLAWLDAVEEDVSGGRGRVRRIAAGTCSPIDTAAATVDIHDGPFAGRLTIVPAP